MDRPTRVPLDYLDKLCLSGTSREHGTTASLVWQLTIEGDFNEAIALDTVAALARRYPTIASRVRSAEPGKDWRRTARLVYEVDEQPDPRDLLQCVDLSRASSAESEAVRRSIYDGYFDPSAEYLTRFIWVRTGPRIGTLFLQQHHAIADGRACIEFIEELTATYQRVAEGDALADVTPVGKLSEEVVAEPRRWVRWWYQLVGILLHVLEVIRASLRPTEQLACNQLGDPTGHNDVVHLVLDDAVLLRLRALKEREGLSSNDVFSGSLAKAVARWSAELGKAVRRFNFLIIADVRPRGGLVRSFANHLSSFLIKFKYDSAMTPKEMARTVRRQVNHQYTRRNHIKKLLAEVAVTRRLSIARIQAFVFKAKRAFLNFTFSNMIPFSPEAHGGRFATSSWTGTSFRLMTPCPYLQWVNVSVVRYGGRLCFNFNYKQSIISREEVDRLVAMFVENLGALGVLSEPETESTALAA